LAALTAKNKVTTYKIIRSNRKTLCLSVDESARLTVRAPNRASDKQIHEFVSTKESWINKKQQLMRDRLDEYESHLSLPQCLYLGKLYPLKLIPGRGDTILFNGSDFTVSHSNEDKIKLTLNYWYKQRFIDIAKPRVSYYAKKYNLAINRVNVKSQKTLWGSCSGNNNINLNYQLIMAPIEVIDYVIVHELVHTLHKNHSPSFWQEVGLIMPKYKASKSWLKENGYKLRQLQ
jgi:hypothetical protein